MNLMTLFMKMNNPNDGNSTDDDSTEYHPYCVTIMNKISLEIKYNPSQIYSERILGGMIRSHIGGVSSEDYRYIIKFMVDYLNYTYPNHLS